jgi:GNAT superfamily N-acetyltransferase
MQADLSSRPFADEADYQRLRELLGRMVAATPWHYCTLGDLDWQCATDSGVAITDTQLWVDSAGVVRGCAWPIDDKIMLFSDPDYRSLEAEMLDWAEARRRATVPPGAAPTLSAIAYDRDTERVALLTARGYQQQQQGDRYRQMSLQGQLPAPVVPAGYTLRQLQPDTELAGQVAAHRAAFAPSKMTVEKQQKVLAAPTYRPDLDLVVLAPTGDIAAYTLIWFDAANRMGIFEPMATAPAHQRRGLATALLAEGVQRLQALGAETACINTGMKNEASNRAYAGFGFQLVAEEYHWTKTLAAAQGEVSDGDHND